MTFTTPNSIPRASAPCATAAASMSTASAPYASAKRAFCCLPTTFTELTSTPRPDSTSVRTPSAALITALGMSTSPTRSDAPSAPAKPTEITRAGLTSSITASVARRAGSAPMPPHISAASLLSKRRYRRPECSMVFRFQFRTSGLTSRSIAATIAILGMALDTASDVAVRLEPLNRPPQRSIDRNHPPAQLPLRFR